MSELVLYTSEDGKTRLDLRVDGQTIWLTQLEIADLFQTTKQNVSLHAKNIFDDGELTQEATVKDSLTVQTEGKRDVQRSIQLYNLDLNNSYARDVTMTESSVLPLPPTCYAPRSIFKSTHFFSPNGASFDSPGQRPGIRPQTRFQALKGRHHQRSHLIHAISQSIMEGGEA